MEDWEGLLGGLKGEGFVLVLFSQGGRSASNKLHTDGIDTHLQVL